MIVEPVPHRVGEREEECWAPPLELAPEGRQEDACLVRGLGLRRWTRAIWARRSPLQTKGDEGVWASGEQLWPFFKGELSYCDGLEVAINVRCVEQLTRRRGWQLISGNRGWSVLCWGRWSVVGAGVEGSELVLQLSHYDVARQYP